MPTRSCTPPRCRARTSNCGPPTVPALPCCIASAALAALAAIRRTVAIAGSHGKTTTASMLALVLRSGRSGSPSFVIGADVNEVGANAAYRRRASGSSSKPTRATARSCASIPTRRSSRTSNPITSSLRRVRRSGARVRGVRRRCCRPARSRRRRSGRVATGRGASARPYVWRFTRRDYRIVDEQIDEKGCRFTLIAGDTSLGSIAVPVGVRAASNGAAAAAIALELGVPFEAIVSALAGFGGVARRFQYRGERDGVTFIDDYAHLPTEVAAAIETARQRTVAPDHRRCSSRTATRVPRRSGPSSATRSPPPTPRAHRRVPRG